MKRRVSIRATAVADIRESRAWYESNRRGLGDEFLIAIADALNQLENTPTNTHYIIENFGASLSSDFLSNFFIALTENR
jgi:hypothetical protein